MVSDPGHLAGHHGYPLQDGLIVIHTHAPALLVAMLDHGHALLPQEVNITSMLPHREWSTKQNHQDRLKNVMRSADPILLNVVIIGMLSLVMPSSLHHRCQQQQQPAGADWPQQLVSQRSSVFMWPAAAVDERFRLFSMYSVCPRVVLLRYGRIMNS